MSVSLGNRFELCALKGVVPLPCPENPAYSRLDARWPAWRTAGCLGPLFAKCLGARSLLAVVELFGRRLGSAHALAGHAFALENEILAEAADPGV